MHEAHLHLAAHDPIMATLIDRFSLPEIERHHEYYRQLARSIIGQQLSVKAAAAINRRFIELFGGDEFPNPEQIIAKDIDELRTAGLSRAKALYIRDLAAHVLDGSVQFDHLDALSNDEIMHKLIAIKGVGEWTVHMFLMFSMRRMDVLPIGDLGIRNGVARLYGLTPPASIEQVREIAETHQWHPYESVACRYVWASLDNEPA